MYANPPQNARVRIHYRKGVAETMPFQGRIGTIRISGRGKPRNHLVEIDGKLAVIPCGNLNKHTEAPGDEHPTDATNDEIKQENRG